MFGAIGMPELIILLVVILVVFGAAKGLRRSFREGLTGQSIPPSDFERKMSTPIGLPIFGLFGGALVGFLLRPAIPLVGQLPIDVVLTRGVNLQGLDVLARSTAEASFNYVVVGAIIGLLAAGIGLSRMRRQVQQHEAQSAAVVPTANIPPTTPASGSKFCAQCGTSLTSNAKFCASCGSSIRA